MSQDRPPLPAMPEYVTPAEANRIARRCTWLIQRSIREFKRELYRRNPDMTLEQRQAIDELCESKVREFAASMPRWREPNDE